MWLGGRHIGKVNVPTAVNVTDNVSVLFKSYAVSATHEFQKPTVWMVRPIPGSDLVSRSHGPVGDDETCNRFVRLV